MDTHAIYEGAMRLLAAMEGASDGRHIYDVSDEEIEAAIDIAIRTAKAAGIASGFTSKAIVTPSAVPMTETRTDAPVPTTFTAPTPSADAFRSTGAV